jgi:hypothetical protein
MFANGAARLRSVNLSSTDAALHEVPLRPGEAVLDQADAMPRVEPVVQRAQLGAIAGGGTSGPRKPSAT